MVTGREMPDLKRACSRLDLFDRIVAENGALVYNPSTKEARPLGPPPPPSFVAQLEDLGIEPLSVGQAIVATGSRTRPSSWKPSEN